MIFWSSFPFVRLVIPFGVGIFIGVNFSLELTPIIIITFIALSLCLLLLHFFNQSFKANYLTGIVITCLFCLLGACYSSIHNEAATRGLNSAPTSTTWLGQVKSVERKQGEVKSIVLQIQKFKNDGLWENGNFKLLAYNKDSLFDVRVGDIISGEGKLRPIMAPQNPAQFNYRLFLKNKNIYLTTFEDGFVKVKSSNSLVHYAERARSSIIQIYRKLQVEEENLAVLVALTLGDKSYIDFELRKQYAGAGAMHILAVSGLHVGIIFLIFNFLLSKMPDALVFRILRTCILLFVIWAFAFLAGFSPSVQRAGWMFSFVILSKLLKRNSNVLNSIAVSAFLLLLIDPNNLFQVGFQLSYSAVIGIVLIHPVIYKLLYFPNWFFDKIWSLLVVSLAAQIATLPYTLAYFHQFPNYFLLANLLVIPLAFGIVSGAVIITSLFFLFGTDFFLTNILDLLLTALNGVIVFITELPGAMTEGVWLNDLSIIFVIGTVSSFVVFMYYRSFRALVFALCLIVGIQITELANSYQTLQNHQITFYALTNPTWSIVNGRRAEVYSLEGGREYDKKMVADHMNSIGVQELKWSTVKNETNKIFSVGSKVILLFPEIDVAHQLGGEVDIIIQSSNIAPSLSGKTVVLDYFYRDAEKLTVLNDNSNYYHFRKDKAFKMSISRKQDDIRRVDEQR